MGKGLPRSHSRGGFAGAAKPFNVYRASALPITVDGASGVGWGTAVLGDFPEGNILFLGAVAYMTFTGPTSANLGDTWSGDFGIGTTPADDGTISVGDVDIIPSTAVGPAVAEVSPRTRGTQADGALAGQVFDNTDGSLELNLNLLIDDADIGADGIAMTADGVLLISVSVLGDD